MTLREHPVTVNSGFAARRPNSRRSESRERKENRIRRVTKGDARVESNSLLDARPKLISLAATSRRVALLRILEECISILEESGGRTSSVARRWDTRRSRVHTRKSSFTRRILVILGSCGLLRRIAAQDLSPVRDYSLQKDVLAFELFP